MSSQQSSSSLLWTLLIGREVVNSGHVTIADGLLGEKIPNMPAANLIVAQDPLIYYITNISGLYLHILSGFHDNIVDKIQYNTY